jgi:hypothetical protein
MKAFARGTRRRDSLLTAFVALSGFAAFYLAFRFWRGSFGVPLVYSGDAEAMLMFAKSIIDHGWVQENPSLGAPFGQEMYDFPLGGDNLNFAAIWVIALFSSNVAVVVNVFYALTFSLVAVSAMLALRGIGVGRLASYCLAIAYALTPFHLSRSENHLFLAAYYSVPLAVYIGVRAFRGDLPITFRGARLEWLGLGLAAVVIASAGVYMCVFGVLVITALGLAGYIRRRDWRGARTVAILLSGIVFVGILNQSQSIVYQWNHGENEVVAERFPAESESYALKLTGMVLPTPGSPLDSLGHLRRDYTNRPENQVPAGASTEPLGFVATVGLLLLLGIGFIAIVGRSLPERLLTVELRALAIAATVCLAVATVGGFSSLFALTVTRQIRAWDRMVLVLAFLSLAAIGLVLSQAHQWLRRRVAPVVAQGASGLGAVVLVAFVFCDQATSSYVPAYTPTAASYEADRRFVGEAVRRLGDRAQVLQLPYVGFPETANPDARVGPYSNVRGYLHSPPSVRWSYGAMRGRPTDTTAVLTRLPVREMIAGAVGEGFTALWIDRFGFPLGTVPLERELRSILGPPVLAREDGRYVVYTLKRVHGVLAPLKSGLETASLRPLSVLPSAGLTSEMTFPDGIRADSAGTAIFSMVNPRQASGQVRISGQILPAQPGPWTLSITIQGRIVRSWSQVEGRMAFSKQLKLQPGTSPVTLSLGGPARQPVPFQLSSFGGIEPIMLRAGKLL